MLDLRRELAWEFLAANFPERQVYIRSDGRVQFFTFNPLMQAILAGASLLLLGWVAFTSVNTIFQDRIIASKEQSFRQMQMAYETRIADLRIAYDRLNGAVVVTEDRFRALVGDIEAKHDLLASLIRSKEDLRGALGLEASVLEPATEIEAGQKFGPQFGNAGDLDFDSRFGIGGDPDFEPNFAIENPDLAPPPASEASGTISRPPAVTIPFERGQQPAPRGALPPHTFLKGAVRTLGDLFRSKNNLAAVDHPSLDEITALEARLDRVLPAQRVVVGELQQEMARDADLFRQAIKTTGLNIETLLTRLGDNGGMGGPELVISAPMRPDQIFDDLAVEAATTLEDLTSLAAALRRVPLVSPVTGEGYWQASGFGTRKDPFTKRLAFHGGLDFSGPLGSAVEVTAPGVVVFAGPRGAYGNSVEVDHGYGLKTRYGHLSKILVSVGARMDKGDTVGTLGSTGRSTGPHVHYEVWFDNAIRNPSKFLKAGRYVYEEQRT